MIWCTVDPGKSGAIVRWEGDQPVERLEVSVPKGQRFFERPELDAFCDIMEGCDLVVMEAFLDNKQGPQSSIHTNTTASNHGFQQACARYEANRLEIVRAVDWKRRMGVAGKTVDKYAALEMARILFPGQADWLTRKKDLDTAEALLIGRDYIIRRDTNG